MIHHLKKLTFAVIGFGILLNVLNLTGTPVYAQSDSPYANQIAQATPTDPLPDDDTDFIGPEIPDAEPAAQPEPTCESSVSALGWIFCPLFRITHGVFSWLVDVVLEDGLLRIDLRDDGEAQLREAWAGFQTIANLIFALVFLVIIYAEASGRIGILETYSFTRLLPKMILSVIGIQLSYFFSAYLVDLFNDLGQGVTQLVLAPVEGFSQFELTFTNFGDGTFFGLPVSGVGEGFVDSLVGVAAIAAVGYAALIILPLVLLAAVFGLALLFFTLIIRKVLIVALVVVSPIAFAAAVLPGTERIFRLWWDSFIKALAMYPLIMLFIASGQLVGRLAVTGDATFLDSIIGIIATFGPLFLIPATFRLAGTAVAAVGNLFRSGVTKGKGDPRDPNSLASWARNRGAANKNRLLDGTYKIGGQRYGVTAMPAPLRTGIKRLPFVDAKAPLVADMAEGQKWVDGYMTSGDDDIIRMIALTGGGRFRGRSVNTEDGKQVYTGWVKHEKALWRGADGQGELVTNAAGVPYMAKWNTQTEQFENTGKLATSGDFYTREQEAEVRSMNLSRGRLMHSAVYTMGKSNGEYAQSQVWNGMNNSKWGQSELNDYINGIWALNQGKHQHLKFLDRDYFDDGKTKPRPGQDAPVKMMNISPDKAAKSFESMLPYVYENMESYPMSKQGGAFWRAMSRGVSGVDANGEFAQGTDQRRRIDEPYQRVDQSMRMRQTSVRNPGDDDDDFDGNSQASLEAVHEMKRFKEAYERKFGVPPRRNNGGGGEDWRNPQGYL